MASFRAPPIMRVAVLTPDELLDAVVANLQTRGAQVLSVAADDDRQLIEASVPLAGAIQLADDLNRIAAGRASCWIRSWQWEVQGDGPDSAGAAGHLL